MEWTDRSDQAKAEVLSYRGQAFVAAAALAVLLGALLFIAMDMSSHRSPAKAAAARQPAVASGAPARPDAAARPPAPTTAAAVGPAGDRPAADRPAAVAIDCPPALAKQGATCWRTQ